MRLVSDPEVIRRMLEKRKKRIEEEKEYRKRDREIKN